MVFLAHWITKGPLVWGSWKDDSNSEWNYTDVICLVTISEPIPVTYNMAQIELWASFETLFPCDCKREGDTHSWPFHSCAMASSGCRTCVHPDRRTAPDPWNHRGASPSGSPSALSSYISPLEERPDRGENKVGKLSKEKASVHCNRDKFVTDKNVHESF